MWNEIYDVFRCANVARGCVSSMRMCLHQENEILLIFTLQPYFYLNILGHSHILWNQDFQVFLQFFQVNLSKFKILSKFKSAKGKLLILSEEKESIRYDGNLSKTKKI